MAERSADKSQPIEREGDVFLDIILIFFIAFFLSYMCLKYLEKRWNNIWYDTLFDWVPVKMKERDYFRFRVTGDHMCEAELWA